MANENDKNLMARSGWTGFSDADYVNEFALNPNGDLNAQMFDKAEQMNYEAYLSSGMSDQMARARAKERKQKAMQEARAAFTK